MGLLRAGSGLSFEVRDRGGARSGVLPIGRLGFCPGVAPNPVQVAQGPTGGVNVYPPCGPPYPPCRPQEAQFTPPVGPGGQFTPPVGPGGPPGG